MKFQFEAMAAVASGRVIGGVDGVGAEALWAVPFPEGRLRVLTSGNTVVFGRKTWDMLTKDGKKAGDLFPSSQVVVLTTRIEAQYDGVTVEHNIVDLTRNARNEMYQGKVIIAGGLSLFHIFLGTSVGTFTLARVNTEQSGEGRKVLMPGFEGYFTSGTPIDINPDYTILEFKKKTRKPVDSEA